MRHSAPDGIVPTAGAPYKGPGGRVTSILISHVDHVYTPRTHPCSVRRDPADASPVQVAIVIYSMHLHIAKSACVDSDAARAPLT